MCVAVTPRYIKVNQTPYLLELDLWGTVDSAGAVVRMDAASRRILITVKKVAGQPWPQALADPIPKSELIARRAESVAAQYAMEAAVGSSFTRAHTHDER